MAETTQDSAASAAEEDNDGPDLRGLLLKRLAMAGVLVVFLLAVLALFDYLAAPPDDDEGPNFSKPVPVAPQRTVAKPVTPTENLEAPPAASEVPKPEAAPSPEAVPTPAATVEPTSTPSVPGASLAPPVHTETRTPAVARLPATVRGAPVVAAPARRAEEPPPPLPAALQAVTPAAVQPAAEELAPPRLQSRGDLKPGEAKSVPAQMHRLFSGFVLQAGVFASSQRAEELHARLTLSGVPSTLETRVQVGPFRTRQEAEAAQAKLKALGIDSVMVPPRETRR